MLNNFNKLIIRNILPGMVILLATISSAWAGSWANNVNIGGFNKVHIYTPDSVSPIGQGKSLMLVLHGCVQSIDVYLNANLAQTAEQYGMVIAVPDAMNKAGYSCWSYWQGTKSRTSGDYKNLITLANTLSADSSRNIDPNQVYIAGLSSGASFANTTGCLAPDVFAGMGISAGPSIGTSSSGALGPCETADVESRCNQYAGSYSSFFETQVASIAQGEDDTTVNLCYNQQNAEGMADVYGVSQISGTNTISEGAGHSADETLWQDGRVSMLWFNNVDHSWSGGQGASGAYISGNSVNYASYLAQYFIDHNQRVDRNNGPELSNIDISVNNDTIVIVGTAVDADGSVSTVSATFTDSNNAISTATTTVNSNNSFTLSSGSLSDDLYVISIVATDNDNADSEIYQDTVRVGPEPPASAPQISNLDATVNGQCATISGNVIDANQNLASVDVQFDIGTVSAQISGTNFSAEQCNLPGGTNVANITAADLTNLVSTDSISFEIDAGQKATLDQHISAGRLDYTNYANCYLEYSTNSFTLNETQVGVEQCQWQDDDASCVGPTQSCSGASGGEGSEEPDECSEFSTNNYSHKLAGRAYSTGYYYAPDYFAAGSDEPLSGSTYGINTLYSTDDSNWHLGSCPE
ncbi:alpha/beta hydrolase family esterase [Neptunicella sp. SCSIO 80796]|uniref:extracellular catalytic domain type 1 short-chain-length polyhydroxyalkanoate depolymerase n=1 Tax=Neptunicella plasticusilytica TaxID=3117012 RepID=UPI003A4E31D1